MNNEIDRFSLAIDAIDRVSCLQRIGGHAKEKFRNARIAWRAYATGMASTARRLSDGDGRYKPAIPVLQTKYLRSGHRNGGVVRT